MVTLKSNESERSAKPSPVYIVRPSSAIRRITKYRLESITDSTAIPGNASTGHLAYNSPELRSSSFKVKSLPLATIRKRPVQNGVSNPQSAAR
ncbi:hypothetical protein T265_04512 [Opisthorchis viverrini]|uniref:Uncharacterized protein n=1 Tax=Opisthorchis viverrini TaxID=6198 RepID=A0A075AGH6_OPIVI|nr:hypothetical protein T265_04512 [Opisthorchis viverrini]KER28724.1 hypothetical protein T265_04512 [Opisthorchis viverrini]